MSVVKWTASGKKEEPVSKDKNADIQKWLKKREASAVVKGDRKVEKHETVVVIDCFEPEYWNIQYEIKNDKKLLIISYFVVGTNK